MLPETLVCLLNAAIVLAQTRQQLALNAVQSFNTQKLPNPPSFTLPSNNQLTVSVALCSVSDTSPRFFISNSSTSADPGSSGGEDVFEIAVQNGHGNWTGTFTNGGVLAVENNGAQVSFDVGVSDNGPIHEVLNVLPFFGDTTSNQALLFSPPFDKPNIAIPSYPNYTLPAASSAFSSSPPSSPPNFTLIASPTSSSLASGPQTGCFLLSQNTTGTIANESLWLRDEAGWRTQWLMAGLLPSTNYTAYTVQDGTKVGGPIYFATKSGSFPCPLVASLPYCPAVSYAVPLPAPPTGSTYDSTNLPTNITAPLLSYLANFTTTLSTFACGRDWYSPLVGCNDCEREYRKWLCAVSFSRCSEASPESPGAFTAIPAPPSATGISASKTVDSSGKQQVLSALLPQESPRNSALPTMDYTMLLPCLETCTVVDRACPPFIKFQCPTRKFNAAASYGVGYIDGADGDEGEGITGRAQDRWGNLWCHLG